MEYQQEYFSEIKRIINTVEQTQSDVISQVGAMMGEVVASGGMIFLFGTGHSHILAEELFYRAGGLVRIYPILVPRLMLHEGASASSMAERESGYAKKIFDEIACKRPGDMMFIFSNSGRNTVSVDMALEASCFGMKTVCVTNLQHAMTVSSRHPSGKKLTDVCNAVIDNCGCLGDAAIATPYGRIAPTSTVVGSLIMQSILCAAVEACEKLGYAPEIFQSANTDGGDAANSQYIEAFSKIIPML